jgi:hypothetical protein
MKRLTLVVLAVAIAASLAGAASAQPGARNVDRREWRQQVRIHRGVVSGRLTPLEARRLRMGERHLRRMELRFRADGRLGPCERVRLHRALDRQDARIWWLKHNGRSI